MENTNEANTGPSKIQVAGSLYDQNACDELTAMVTNQLNGGNKTVVVDLEKCKAISAYGVGQLLTLTNTAKNQEGKVTFSGLRPEVRETLEMLLVSNLLELK